eukprot:1174660-Pleurochrysis_carterae.AAC.1
MNRSTPGAPPPRPPQVSLSLRMATPLSLRVYLRSNNRAFLRPPAASLAPNTCSRNQPPRLAPDELSSSSPVPFTDET